MIGAKTIGITFWVADLLILYCPPEWFNHSVTEIQVVGYLGFGAVCICIGFLIDEIRRRKENDLP